MLMLPKSLFLSKASFQSLSVPEIEYLRKTKVRDCSQHRGKHKSNMSTG